MTEDEIIEIQKTWNIDIVKKELENIFNNNSEIDLLSVLKSNSFLFYELFARKYGIQPIFHEVSFGNNYRCDFAWLNDNSDGPEWVLVEIEKPNMQLFTKKNEPTQYLNHAIEQVRSWERYFDENPHEKRKIFGAVARFRYILVAGSKEEWQEENHAKWRIHHNKNSNIEIHSSDILLRPLRTFEEHPEEFWSFAEHPYTQAPSQLQPFWQEYDYMDYWRKII